MFLASWVKASTLFLLSMLFGAFEGSWSAALWSVLVNAALAAALAPPIFALLAGAQLPAEREAG